MSDEAQSPENESTKLLTLEQARDLFPSEDPPSMRWISKMAWKAGCYVKAGRRVYVTSDLVERIREWQAENPVRRGPAPDTIARRYEARRPAKSNKDSINKARELIAEIRRKAKDKR